MGETCPVKDRRWGRARTRAPSGSRRSGPAGGVAFLQSPSRDFPRGPMASEIVGLLSSTPCHVRSVRPCAAPSRCPGITPPRKALDCPPPRPRAGRLGHCAPYQLGVWVGAPAGQPTARTPAWRARGENSSRRPTPLHPPNPPRGVPGGWRRGGTCGQGARNWIALEFLD